MTMHCLEYSAMEWRGHGKQPPEGGHLLLWFMDLPAAGNDHSGYSCRPGSPESATET